MRLMGGHTRGTAVIDLRGMSSSTVHSRQTNNNIYYQTRLVDPSLTHGTYEIKVVVLLSTRVSRYDNIIILVSNGDVSWVVQHASFQVIDHFPPR